MKKYFFPILAIVLSACSNYLAEDEDLDADISEASNNTIQMTVKVRSATEETVNYPVSVYIFNQTGNQIGHHEITEAKQNLDIKLAKGTYKLASFTGLNPNLYKIPEQPTYESSIETDKGKPCPTPIQFGHISFDLQKKLNLSIHLNYIVSSLEFIFQNIPEDATSVEVGISPTSATFSMAGEYSNDKYMCKTICKHANQEWTAGPVYILPSNQSKITLTLLVERPSGGESLSYTYESDFDAAQPYRFTGRYNDGISLGGAFEVIGWKPSIDVEFDLGEGGNNEGNDDNQGGGSDKSPGDPSDNKPTPSSSSILYCNKLPQAGDFFEDHYVWKSELRTGKEASAVLISKQQWFNILAVDGPEYLEQCRELNLNQWRVFTKEEAKEFYAEFNDGISKLNGLLSQHDQDEFYFYNKERYLCNDCTSTFCVSGSNRITAAGAKQTYYMRAIKDVTFKVK